MPKPHSPPDDFPEFAVSREVLMRFFDPPIGDTKFTQLVSRGVIVRSRVDRTRYLLNHSLVRLGLRPVRDTSRVPGNTRREMVPLACWLAAPDLCLRPTWLSGHDEQFLVFALNLAIRILGHLDDLTRASGQLDALARKLEIERFLATIDWDSPA